MREVDDQRSSTAKDIEIARTIVMASETKLKEIEAELESELRAYKRDLPSFGKIVDLAAKAQGLYVGKKQIADVAASFGSSMFKPDFLLKLWDLFAKLS